MVTRLALVLLLLTSVARAQLAGNPLAAAGSPTFTGVVTFTADPQVQASLNVGDVVSNGTGLEPAIFTTYRVQIDRSNQFDGFIGKDLIAGTTSNPANRSTVLEFIGDGGTGTKQYVFLNGHLGTGSTFASPAFTSTTAGTFGIESTDTTLALVTAPAGTNQTPLRALTVTTAGAPVTANFAEPLPTCGATIQGAQVFDTTLSPKQLCVCNAVPRWCAVSVPGCTTGTTTVCGTT